MNKARIQEALDIIEEELWKTTTEEEISMAVYQVYTTANGFITEEIKRIMKEEGEVRSHHPEIAPLFKFHEAILPVLKKYSSIVREREEVHEQKTNVL